MAITALVGTAVGTPVSIATTLKTAMDAVTITNIYGVSVQVQAGNAWAYFVYD